MTRRRAPVADIPPSLADLYQAFEDLFAAQRRLRGRDSKEFDGVTLAQFRVLRALLRHGNRSTGDLAALTGTSPASVTALVDGLERRGLVERTRLEHDRRVVEVALTAEGRRRARASQAHHARRFEELLGELPEADRAVGAEVLRRCAAYLDSL